MIQLRGVETLADGGKGLARPTGGASLRRYETLQLNTDGEDLARPRRSVPPANVHQRRCLVPLPHLLRPWGKKRKTDA